MNQGSSWKFMVMCTRPALAASFRVSTTSSTGAGRMRVGSPTKWCSSMIGVPSSRGLGVPALRPMQTRIGSSQLRRAVRQAHGTMTGDGAFLTSSTASSKTRTFSLGALMAGTVRPMAMPPLWVSAPAPSFMYWFQRSPRRSRSGDGSRTTKGISKSPSPAAMILRRKVRVPSGR